MQSTSSIYTTAILRNYSKSIPFLLLILGIYLVPIAVFQNDLSDMPGDLGDTRFNSYILEHGYKYLSGQEQSFWDAPFMVPRKDVISLSDNLIGTLPIYSAFRLLNFDRETSFQLWVIALFALNYLFTYLILLKVSCHKIIASVGAYIFAFSIYNVSHFNHIQVYPKFILPVCIYMAYLFLSTGKLKYYIGTGVVLAYQFYCGMYLGVFATISIIVLSTCYFIVYRNFPALKFVSNYKNIIHFTLYSTIILLLMFPLLHHYLSVEIKLGFTTFEESLPFLPQLKSYFFATNSSKVWGILSNEVAYNFDYYYIQYLFTGITPYIGCLFAIYYLIKSKTNPELRKLILVFLLSLIVFVVLFIRIGNFSIFKFIMEIPGIGSIREIIRIIHIQVLFLIALATIGFIQLAKTNSVLKYTIYLLPLIVIYDNSFDPAWIRTYNKKDGQQRVNSLKQNLTQFTNSNYKTLAYCPINVNKDYIFEIHIDAMLACQDLNKSCVNAYTGNFPPQFLPFYYEPSKNSLESWFSFMNAPTDSIYISNEYGFQEINRETIYLKSSEQFYLSTEYDHKIIADKNHTQLWEEYTLIQLVNDQCLIRTYNNNFVYADSLDQNKIKYKEDISSSSYFSLDKSGDNFVSLKAYNNKLVTTIDQFLFATSDSSDSRTQFQYSLK